METKVVDESQKDQWNQFVAICPFGDILQSWEWGEVKKSKIWTPIRIAVFEKEEIVGAAQILQRKLLGSFLLLYCPRGPVVDWEQSNATDILTALVEYIKSSLSEGLKSSLSVTRHSLFGVLFLRIEPLIAQERITNNKSQITNLGFRSYFKSIQPRHTAIVDLSPSEEKILASFEKDTRYSVRRAEREGVEVGKVKSQKSKVKSNEKLRVFYKLYLETSKRGEFTPRPWEQFEKIGKLMMPKDLARLYFAYFKDELLAAALILKIGKKAYYVWGASTRTHPKKFAPYLLQWEVIKDLKDSGVASYDLWGIAPTDKPEHAWSGHTLFKKGFSGKRVDFVGCFDLPLSPLYFVYRTLDYTRQRVLKPDLLS